MNVTRSCYYRAQHVTGPAAVLVSVRFGKTPPSGPRLTRILSERHAEPNIGFDIARHVDEVIEGVAQANRKFNGSLQVEEIQVVPDDYPSAGQVRHVAFQIAKSVILQEC